MVQGPERAGVCGVWVWALVLVRLGALGEAWGERMAKCTECSGSGLEFGSGEDAVEGVFVAAADVLDDAGACRGEVQGLGAAVGGVFPAFQVPACFQPVNESGDGSRGVVKFDGEFCRAGGLVGVKVEQDAEVGGADVENVREVSGHLQILALKVLVSSEEVEEVIVARCWRGGAVGAFRSCHG
jgi:hypothetical protein